MKKFKECTSEEIKLAISNSENLNQVCKQLLCTDNTYNRNKIRDFIKSNNLSIAHFKTRYSKESYDKNPKVCKYCGKIIPYEKRVNDFCNHSCATSYNNVGVVRNKPSLPTYSLCLNCGKEITKGNKYCNNTCKAEYERKEYIKRWKAGKESGIIGKDKIATAVKVYLREKYKNSCQCCGWHEINPYTGLVPLQIHHIDGDCLNNKESNLQLLCPNCHALTENFGSRNKNCTRIDKRKR